MYLASPGEHRTTSLLQVLLNAHQTKATTAIRKRFKVDQKSPITTVLWIPPHLFRKVPLPHQEHEKVSSCHTHLAHKSEHLHQIEPKNAKPTLEKCSEEVLLKASANNESGACT